jgi:hypothetical protein
MDILVVSSLVFQADKTLENFVYVVIEIVFVLDIINLLKILY